MLAFLVGTGYEWPATAGKQKDAAMSWKELQSILNSELEALAPRVPNIHQLAHSRDLIPDTLLDLEHASTGAVDAAVAQFAHTRAWPGLSPVERTMLAFRLEHACGLCALFLMGEGDPMRVIAEPSLDIPEEYVLEWLLTTAWHNAGFLQLHDTIERTLRSGSA